MGPRDDEAATKPCRQVTWSIVGIRRTDSATGVSDSSSWEAAYFNIKWPSLAAILSPYHKIYSGVGTRKITGSKQTMVSPPTQRIGGYHEDLLDLAGLGNFVVVSLDLALFNIRQDAIMIRKPLSKWDGIGRRKRKNLRTQKSGQ
ncbi:hypothetical protein HPP92_028821 [Vanilla planifolia]|uniref:Uncharacterized protein n=1 Tax=Vanilla planifolia TaxID=51239 RepID=A0A835P4P1_VANPL|nr:hypothetical protein HPP92_028821 [Vanilla planifolia]KAG0446493.1 hypothetical protein HPP92_028810 [Vanilla planifolia]